MADMLSTAERSAHMAKIRGKDTKPEVAVRRLLTAAGYRYRLHAKDLPGRPDIAIRSRRRAIFVHGCFWHGHQGCKSSHVPKTHSAFWTDKFSRNIARDARNQSALEAQGYAVEVVWECEVRDRSLPARLAGFLGPPRIRPRRCAEG